jgi:hypothetical protein
MLFVEREIGERFGAHNVCNVGTIPNCYAPSISQTCRFHTVSRPFDATNCGGNNSARRVGSHFNYFVGIAAVPPVSAWILKDRSFEQQVLGLPSTTRIGRLSPTRTPVPSPPFAPILCGFPLHGVSGFLLLMRWSDRPENNGSPYVSRLCLRGRAYMHAQKRSRRRRLYAR